MCEVMDKVAQLQAEFEAVGEAEVAERLHSNFYKGADRAVAMRWMNDRSLARVGIHAPAHGALLDPNSRRIAHAERITRMAILCAVAALLAAIGSLGLSVQNLLTFQSLRQTVAPAAAQPAPGQASTPSH
jgi:hypothetical protein